MTGLPQLLAWGRPLVGGDDIWQPLGFQTKSQKYWGSGLEPLRASGVNAPGKMAFQRPAPALGKKQTWESLSIPGAHEVRAGELETSRENRVGGATAGTFTSGRPTETEEKGQEAGEDTRLWFAMPEVGHHGGSSRSRPAPSTPTVFKKLLGLLFPDCYLLPSRPRLRPASVPDFRRGIQNNTHAHLILLKVGPSLRRNDLSRQNGVRDCSLQKIRIVVINCSPVEVLS